MNDKTAEQKEFDQICAFISDNRLVSCNVCKYGEICNYHAQTYYCRSPYGAQQQGDIPIVTNCYKGELDKNKYEEYQKEYQNKKGNR